MIVIPETFARSTVAREGERGTAWLSELPAIVDELLDRWECVPDGRAEGLLSAPRQCYEPDAFTAWGGRGAVLLYERDDGRFAMLLERARTSTLAAIKDGDEIAAIAGCISRRLTIPAPHGLPRLSDQADAWEEQLRKDAAEPEHTLSSYAVNAALATIRELSRVQPDTLVHGDHHARSILRADREPWLAVDLKGHSGDPAYDGGTFLRTFLVRLLKAGDPRKALDRVTAIFAEAADLDRERTRRWAQLHIVQSAFWDLCEESRIAGHGTRLQRITELADHMSDLLVRSQR